MGVMLPDLLQDLARSASAGASFALLAPSCPPCQSVHRGSISCPGLHCGACELHPPSTAELSVDCYHVVAPIIAALLLCFVIGFVVGRCSTTDTRRRQLRRSVVLGPTAR